MSSFTESIQNKCILKIIITKHCVLWNPKPRDKRAQGCATAIKSGTRLQRPTAVKHTLTWDRQMVQHGSALAQMPDNLQPTPGTHGKVEGGKHLSCAWTPHLHCRMDMPFPPQLSILWREIWLEIKFKITEHNHKSINIKSLHITYAASSSPSTPITMPHHRSHASDFRISRTESG